MRVGKKNIPELYSNQEATGTGIVLYCTQAQEQGYDTASLCNPDNDVFYITLCLASKIKIVILFDTGIANKRRLLNISDLAEKYGQKMCMALMYLHAFTHCDTTSAFKGIGVQPMKLIQKVDFHDALFKLGDAWKFLPGWLRT